MSLYLGIILNDQTRNGMKLKSKLIISNLCVGLIPMLIVGLVAIWMIFNALEKQAYQQLEGRREIKKSQLSDYLNKMFNQLEILIDNDEMQSTYRDFEIEGVDDWSQIKTNDDFLMFEDMRKANLMKWLEGNLWDDILFIERSGRINYNIIQGEALGKQIPTEENKVSNIISNTNLAKAFKALVLKIAANEKGFMDFNYVVSDLNIYPPFKKPDQPQKPVMFFLANIKSTEPDTFNGYMGFMISFDDINTIVTQRDGMGETGEAYLVGADQMMRTNSFRNFEEFSASNSLQKQIKVGTEPVLEALGGNSGIQSAKNYNGNDVLSSFTPITFKGLNWALIVEKEKSESFSTINSIQMVLLVIAVICALVVTLISLVVSHSVTKPLGGEPQDMAEVTNKISSGDLQIDFPDKEKISGLYANMQKMVQVLQDRISFIEKIAKGDLRTDLSLVSDRDVFGKALQIMIKDLRVMIKVISEESKSLYDFSNDLSDISIQMADESNRMNNQSGVIASAVEQMSVNISSVTDAIKVVDSDINQLVETSGDMTKGMTDTTSEVKEMSSSIEEVSQKATIALTISNEAQQKSAEVTETMNVLDSAVGEIGEVTEIIKEIAQQTNLLALNANIEAASAGESGKGFAVVAQEIKELANQSSRSAGEIAEKILSIQAHTQEAVDSISQVVKIILQVNESSELISGLTKNQTTSVHQIFDNIEKASGSLNNASEVIGQVKKASADIAGNSQELNRGIREISKSISEIHQSSGHTKAGSNIVKEKTQKLVEMSTGLREVAGKFKL